MYAQRCFQCKNKEAHTTHTQQRAPSHIAIVIEMREIFEEREREKTCAKRERERHV